MQRHFLPTALLSFLALSSCKEEEIRTYKVAVVPEEETASAPATAAEPASVTWQALDGWTEEPGGQFLTAAYALPGGGRVTVSKLGGDGGGLAANVNRWRGQVGLKPAPENELGGQPFQVVGSGAAMLLFNLNPENKEPDAEGILAGILPLESETWYFKFTGSPEKLNEGGGAFMDFLRSVRVSDGKESTPIPAPAAPGMPKVNVVAPEGWEASEGSAMRAASFRIPAKDGAYVDVSVVPLPGDSGSVLENVNRWRGQLKLAPLESEDDPALGSEKEGAAGKFFLSHMASAEPILEGDKAAIATAIIKTPTYTWFFKMMGEASLVEENLGKFESFVRSATFP